MKKEINTTAQEIIEMALKLNDKLQVQLDLYDLTVDDVGVILYIGDIQVDTLDNYKINIWFDMEEEKITGISVKF